MHREVFDMFQAEASVATARCIHLHDDACCAHAEQCSSAHAQQAMMQEANLIDGNQHGKETAKRDALRSRKRSHSPDAASPQPAAAHAKLLMPAVTGSRGTSQDQQREDYVQVQRRKYQQHMQQEVGQGAVQAPAQPNNATHPSVQQRQAVASTSRSHHGSKLTSQQHSSVSQGRMQQPAASQPPAYTNLGNGWIEWRQDRDINTFLAQKPPSSTSSSEAAWICVRNPAHRDPMELDGGGASCDLQRLLGQARAALSGSGSVQAKLNVIDRVAVAGKCTSGKW